MYQLKTFNVNCIALIVDKRLFLVDICRADRTNLTHEL